MPKVTNPLGGTSAHGQVGKALIFQGNIVKRYAAPKIQKVQGQLDAQDRFQSVTKMIRTMKEWGRGGLSAMLGARWYQMIYGLACQYWEEAEASFNTFTLSYKDEWRDNAPFQNTVLDRGLVFYVCAFAINELAVLNSYDFFGVAPPGLDTAPAARELWDQDLSGVFFEGVYDDPNTDLHFLGGAPYWVSVENVNAYNGSNMVSQSTGISIARFEFFGTRFGIIYHQATMQGTAAVEIDAVNNYTFSQNNVSELWQLQWSSPAFNRGLHRVTISRTGAAGSINIDGIVIYG